jgi:outer membrane murein-binding lipoprotein Lpp
MKNKLFLSSKKLLLLSMCAMLATLLMVGCSNKNKDNIVGKNVISGTCGQNLT